MRHCFYLWAACWSLTSLFAMEFDVVSYSTAPHAIYQGDSKRPRLSRDGRFVVFESASALDPEDNNREPDVYLFDRETRLWDRVAARDTSRRYGAASISDNGNIVVYQALVKMPEEERSARIADVLVFNRRRRVHELITPAFGPMPNDGESSSPMTAMQGRMVLFTSNATNLLSKPIVPIRQAYLYDRYRNALDVVSRNLKGELANRPVGDAKISQDGRVVFFQTPATNIGRVLPEGNLRSHLYRVDRFIPEISEVDIDSPTFESEKWSIGRYDIDEEGETVVFEGRDRTTNDPDDLIGASTLFVYTASSRTVSMLLPSLYRGRVRSPSLSGDGRFVVFVVRSDKKNNVIEGLGVFDRQTQQMKRLVAGYHCENPFFSGDGQTIAFESDEPTFAPGRRAGITYIFVAKNPFGE